MDVGIGVLGPLIVGGEPSPLGHRDRVVLEVLAVRLGEVVSAEQLADALWGEQPPPTWSKVVQGCVVRLRKALGPQAIETLPDGYRLAVPANEVDAHRFVHLVGRARELLTLAEPERASYVAAQALGLWRGRALADLDGWDPGRIEAGRLDELRLDAEELRVEAALRAGRHREVLADTQAGVAEAPLRERRWGLLALAQYQAGRQGEALRTLHRARSVLLTELGLDRGPDLVALEQAILRQDPSLLTEAALPEPSPTCPYLGLVPYDVGDVELFFGRERDLADCLRTLATAGVLAVVGPSGSGKSSLIRAGVAAALIEDGRRVTVVTPGPRPVAALPALPSSSLRPVLVVDQLEEAFLLCADASERARFFTALVAHAETGSLVVAVRADRAGDLSAHPAFARLVERGLHLLGPMAEGDVCAVVERPARQAGLLLEPGLVDLLLRDVEGESGALPLLSHALRQTWERREGRTLTVAGYRETGGIRGAVAQSAERIYDQIPADQRPLLRDLLLRLVTQGADGEPIAAPIPRRTLGSGAEHEHLIELLVRARLVTSDDGVLELAHESLARAWPRLRTWLDDDVEGHRILRHLTIAADTWEAMGRPESELYRGVRLVLAVDWRDRATPALNPTEGAFLDASVVRRDQELAAEEERRTREEQLRRGTRRRTRQLIGSALLLALVGAFAAFAVVQRNEADRLAGELHAASESRRLAAASALAIADDPELAMLLALQSLQASVDGGIPALVESEEALHWAVQAARIAYPASDAPAELRVGPSGPTGIYRLPIADLASLARDNLDRGFIDDECSRLAVGACEGATGLASPSTTGPAAVPAEPIDRPPLPKTQPPLAGSRLTILGGIDPALGLGHELEQFEDRTGIAVSYQFTEESIGVRLAAANAAGDTPDILITGPGEIGALAREGDLIDLSTYVDPSIARAELGDPLVDLATIDSGYYGVPAAVDVKGLVWYPVTEFAQAGYEIPRTWDELIALSETMVADGQSPWCLGLESGGAISGWPGTDWIEALVLRLGGLEFYDQWAAHQVPFDHPTVKRAAEMFGQISFGAGYVRNGPASINRINVLQVAQYMLSEPPGCWLHHQGSYLPNVLLPGADETVDLGFFVLPPVDAGGAAPVFGGVNLVSARTDRPEVREFIESVLNPAWGQSWAGAPNSDFLSPNLRFDPQFCQTAGADPPTNELHLQLCQVARDALATGQWRFDASDLMPPQVGSVDESGRRGAFYQGMLDYVEQGPNSLDRILAEIDAAWADATPS